MNIQQALDKIVANYDKLQPTKLDGLEAIWISKTDHADSYEVDEENIGVTKTGKLAWAYAFGCSYCSGDYETDEKPLDTMKAFTVNHEDMKEKWEKEVIAYAEKLV